MLPSEESAPRAPLSALATAIESVLTDATVLVVDDNPANLVLLERLLAAVGLEHVHSMNDPREVVSWCLEFRPDLVLLDLHMPDMDGVAVLGALSTAVGPDEFLPVLVLTADAGSAARERALAAGAKDFLTKPFDPTEVLLRVRNLLESRAMYVRLQRERTNLRVELEERRTHDRRQESERRLRRARIEEVLVRDQLRMVFQPIVDLGSGRVAGAEALARFDCEPPRPPNEWFADAADVGLAIQLELAAVQAGLAALDELPSGVYLSLNVSPETAIVPALEDLIRRSDGERIVLELTEHVRVAEYEPLLGALDRLRHYGTRIAVDDTGAGYAGLQHLLRLRPDIIKLDTDLTRDIDVDPARRALGAALVTFAHHLDAGIVAEGIETSLELSAVRSLGIRWGQGYHLARPGPLPLPEL